MQFKISGKDPVTMVLNQKCPKKAKQGMAIRNEKPRQTLSLTGFHWSGWRDSNARPHAPQTCTLPG